MNEAAEMGMTGDEGRFVIVTTLEDDEVSVSEIVEEFRGSVPIAAAIAAGNVLQKTSLKMSSHLWRGLIFGLLDLLPKHAAWRALQRFFKFHAAEIFRQELYAEAPTIFAKIYRWEHKHPLAARILEEYNRQPAAANIIMVRRVGTLSREQKAKLEGTLEVKQLCSTNNSNAASSGEQKHTLELRISKNSNAASSGEQKHPLEFRSSNNSNTLEHRSSNNSNAASSEKHPLELCSSSNNTNAASSEKHPLELCSSSNNSNVTSSEKHPLELRSSSNNSNTPLELRSSNNSNAASSEKHPLELCSSSNNSNNPLELRSSNNSNAASSEKPLELCSSSNNSNAASSGEQKHPLDVLLRQQVQLPPDVVRLILEKVPFPYIGNCLLTCRDWLEAGRGWEFDDLLRNQQQGAIVTRTEEDWAVCWFPLQGVTLTLGNFLPRDFRPLDSSEGLVVGSFGDPSEKSTLKLLVLNPLLGSGRWLPELRMDSPLGVDGLHRKVFLEANENRHTYKIVVVEEHQVHIITKEESAWQMSSAAAARGGGQVSMTLVRNSHSHSTLVTLSRNQEILSSVKHNSQYVITPTTTVLDIVYIPGSACGHLAYDIKQHSWYRSKSIDNINLRVPESVVFIPSTRTP